MDYNLFTVLGPTASGKTQLAVKLADNLNGEIISADSRQVYKGLTIGSGKDIQEYKLPEKEIKYHLIDIIDPSLEYNLFRFQKDFFESYQNIRERKVTPILCGGTGLYLSAIIQNYKMKEKRKNSERAAILAAWSIEKLREYTKAITIRQHNTTDLLIKDRIIEAIMIAESDLMNISYPTINSFNIGIKPARELAKKFITERLKKRLEEGMIDEVRTLMQNGVEYDRLLLLGLEYKFIAMYLNNKLNYNDMFQKLNSAIHSFAKKQMTWFRKMEKEGVQINWIEPGDFDSAFKLVKSNFLT